MSSFVNAIIIVTRGLMLLVIADVIASYLLDPFHSVRRFLDNLVQPLLDPIRRLLPPAGPMDFSPIILMILLEVIGRVLAGILI